MSKAFPMDSDYREAIPCEFCGNELECFHINPDKVSCAGCERFYDVSRAIMRFENIRVLDSETHWNKGSPENWFAPPVHAELWAGPQLMYDGPIRKVLDIIRGRGWIVDGVNYSSYQVKRAKQKADLERRAKEVEMKRRLDEEIKNEKTTIN